MIVKKAREIKNARIEFVSLVDRAANKKRFLITKSADDTADFLLTGKILKADRDTHHITGIVYEPMTEDAHGDFMTADEIAKAAYWFAKNGDKVDRQHNFKSLPGVSVVENWVAKSDTEIDGQKIRKGTWLITVEVDDPQIWDGICKGEITGFSMGGVGEYVKGDVSLDGETENAAVEKRSALKKFSEWLGLDSDEKEIKKAGRKISGKNIAALKQISASLNDLIEACEDKETEEFFVKQEDVQKMVDAAVTKALEKQTEARAEQITVGEIEKMVDAAVDKVFNRADPAPNEEAKPDNEKDKKKKPEITEESVKKMIDDAIQKTFAPTELAATAETAVTAENVQAMVTEAVAKAIEPIMKARGLSSNLNGETAIEKHDETHYLAGIL